MQAFVGVGQPHRRGIVMNVCWSPKDGGSGHDRWVSDNGADKWVMMGYASKCRGMQELGWWLFTSMGHKQGTCCFAAMDVTALVVKSSINGDMYGGKVLFRSNHNG